MRLEIDTLSDEALDEVVSLAVGDKDSESLDMLWQMVETAEALAEANKQLADKAAWRRLVNMAEAERIKERILAQLKARDLKAVATSYGKFARQANGGHAPMTIVGQFGDEFARIKREADLDKIRAALKEGEVLDFVEVGERGEHLRLR